MLIKRRNMKGNVSFKSDLMDKMNQSHKGRRNGCPECARDKVRASSSFMPYQRMHTRAKGK